MPTHRLNRGAVVRCNDKTWVVWSCPPKWGGADPIVLPMKPQTAPRHRSQVALYFDGRQVLVHLLTPVTLPRRDCEPIAQCSEEIVSLLAVLMQRAIDADGFERATGFERQEAI